MENNIFNYLHKYGELSFKKFKFNEVDALILSVLSYLSFENLRAPIKTLRFLSNKDIYDLADNTSEREQNSLLLKKLRNTPRFKDIKIMNYSFRSDTEEGIQFSAISFAINLTTIVVAYRGTDGTLLGWKENLMMGCKNEVPAQIKAYEYLKNTLKKHKFSKFYICGHSKGGNLAYYAALKAAENNEAKKIIKVYNFDGPGFLNKDLYNSLDKLEGKLEKFSPEESLVGILLNDERIPMTILKSKGEKFQQHSAYNWCINMEDGKFLCSDSRTEFSLKIEEVFNEWFNRMTPEQVSGLIEVVEALLGKELQSKVSDIDIEKPIKLVWKFLRLNSVDKEKKKQAKEDFLYLYSLVKKLLKES